MFSTMLAGFLMASNPSVAEDLERFDTGRCTPRYEFHDKALHQWCEQLRSDPELHYQNEKLKGLEWIEKIFKEKPY